MDENTLDDIFGEGPPQDTFDVAVEDKTHQLDNFEGRKEFGMNDSNTFQPLYQTLENDKSKEIPEPPPKENEEDDDVVNTQVLDDMDDEDEEEIIEESPLIGEESLGDGGKVKEGNVTGVKRKRDGNDEEEKKEPNLEPKKKKTKLSHFRIPGPRNQPLPSLQDQQPVGPSKEMAKLLGMGKKKSKHKRKNKSPHRDKSSSSNLQQQQQQQQQQNTPGRGLIHAAGIPRRRSSSLIVDSDAEKKAIDRPPPNTFSFDTQAFTARPSELKNPRELIEEHKKKKKMMMTPEKKNKNKKKTSSSSSESDEEFTKRQKEYERRSSVKRDKEEKHRQKEEEMKKRKLEKRERRKSGKEQKRKEKERKRRDSVKQQQQQKKKKKKKKKKDEDDDDDFEEDEITPEKKKRKKKKKKITRRKKTTRGRRRARDNEDDDFEDDDDDEEEEEEGTRRIRRRIRRGRNDDDDDDEEEEEEFEEDEERGRGGRKKKSVVTRKKKQKKKKKRRKNIPKRKKKKQKKKLIARKRRRRRRDDDDDDDDDNTYDYDDRFIDDDDGKRRSKRDDASYQYETQPPDDSTQINDLFTEEEEEEEEEESSDDQQKQKQQFIEDEDEEEELFPPQRRRRGRRRRRRKGNTTTTTTSRQIIKDNLDLYDDRDISKKARDVNKKPSKSRMLQQLISNIEKGKSTPLDKRKRRKRRSNKAGDDNDLNSQVNATFGGGDLLLDEIEAESNLFTIPKAIIRKINNSLSLNNNNNNKNENENTKKKKKKKAVVVVVATDNAPKKEEKDEDEDDDDDDDDDDDGYVWPLQFMITEIPSERRKEIILTIKKNGGRVLESTELSGQFSHNLILITETPAQPSSCLRRTHKTLVSTIFHTPILSPEWIVKSVERGRLLFPIPQEYTLSRSLLQNQDQHHHHQQMKMNTNNNNNKRTFYPNMESLLQLRNHRILDGLRVKILPGVNNSGSVGVWVKCLIQCGAKVIKNSNIKRSSSTTTALPTKELKFENNNMMMRDEDTTLHEVDLLFFLDGLHSEEYREGNADPYPAIPSIGPDHLVRCMYNDISLVFSSGEARMSGNGLLFVNLECAIRRSSVSQNSHVVVGEGLNLDAMMKKSSGVKSIKKKKKKRSKPMKIRMGDVVEYLTFPTPHPSLEGRLGMVMKTGLVRGFRSNHPNQVTLKMFEFVEYEFPEYKLDHEKTNEIDGRSIVRKVKLYPYRCEKSHGRYCTSYFSSMIKKEVLEDDDDDDDEDEEERKKMKTRWNYPKSKLPRRWFQENPEVSQQSKFYSYLLIDGRQYFINEWVRMKCVVNSVELTEIHGRIIEMIGDDFSDGELDEEEKKFVSTLSSSSEESSEDEEEEGRSRRKRKVVRSTCEKGMKILFHVAKVTERDENGRVSLRLTRGEEPIAIKIENIFEIESLRFGFQNDSIIPPPPPPPTTTTTNNNNDNKNKNVEARESVYTTMDWNDGDFGVVKTQVAKTQRVHGTQRKVSQDFQD